MSTQSTTPAPVDTSTPPLRRPHGERIVAGVCAGMARTFGTTPLVVRIVALLIAVTSPPIALIAYAALAIAIPRDDGRQLLGGDPQDTRETVIGWGLVVAALIAVAAGFESTFFGGPGGVILLAGGLVALVVHHQRRSDRVHTSPATPASSAASPTQTAPSSGAQVSPPPRRRFESPYPGPSRPLATSSGEATTAAVQVAPAPVPNLTSAAPVGPREVSVALIGLCAIVAAATVGILLSATGAVDATARGVAIALGIGALALTVGAVTFARRRGAVALVAFAVILALGSLASATVGDHVEDGVGERVETPMTEAELAREYHLGIGSLTIDLTETQLDPGVTTVHGRLGIGEMVFRVPSGVRVTSVGPHRVGGLGVVNALAGPNPTRTIQLDADVDHGSAEVQAVGADGP